MACSVELSLTNLVLFGVLIFAVKKLIAFYKTWKVEKMLEKWDGMSPRDKVLLHTIWRSKTLPSISPYALKLETYLRMAKIPYEMDYTDFIGPKGKLPWITYNGAHVADSHLIIQFLNKKLGINLNKNASVEQLAAARACRVILENHFNWGCLQFRWIENAMSITQLSKFPMLFKLMLPLTSMRAKKNMVAHGIGKHSTTEIYQMTEDDLRTVSTILGSRKFIGGEEPCEDDCAVFGWVAQVLCAMPGSSFESLAHGELKNLKGYFERMKVRFWPDWDSCLDRS